MSVSAAAVARAVMAGAVVVVAEPEEEADMKVVVAAESGFVVVVEVASFADPRFRCHHFRLRHLKETRHNRSVKIKL